MSRDKLSLRYEDNGTAHNDVVLRWDGDEWRCDSYYLALDSGILADREDSEKVRAVLSRLLRQWLGAIRGLNEAGIAYLPYDFSDQCTAWLECRRSGDDLVVTRGWSTIEGWSFSPSDVGDYLRTLEGFRADGPTAKISYDDFLQAIESSLADVG